MLFSVTRKFLLVRVSEARNVAREVLAYAYGESAKSKRHSVTAASQERIRTLLEDTVTVGGLIEMASINNGWAMGRGGWAELHSKASALNRRFLDYPSFAHVGIIPKGPGPREDDTESSLVSFSEHTEVPADWPQIEGRIARLIFLMAEQSWILQLRRCDRKACERLTFTWSSRYRLFGSTPKNFCTPKCRSLARTVSPLQRAINRAEARCKYQGNLAKDARDLGNPEQEKRHRAKEKAARAEILALRQDRSNAKLAATRSAVAASKVKRDK